MQENNNELDTEKLNNENDNLKSKTNSKDYKKLEQDLEEFTKNADLNQTSEVKRKNLENLWSPISKILLIFIITLFGISILDSNASKAVDEYISEVSGTWIDEHNNHYEISKESFEMNSGLKKVPFYKGTITNILKTETGYRVVVKGNQYEIIDNEQQNEKPLNISLELINYTRELKVPIDARLGDNEFSIIRVLDE